MRRGSHPAISESSAKADQRSLGPVFLDLGVLAQLAQLRVDVGGRRGPPAARRRLAAANDRTDDARPTASIVRITNLDCWHELGPGLVGWTSTVLVMPSDPPAPQPISAGAV